MNRKFVGIASAIAVLSTASSGSAGTKQNTSYAGVNIVNNGSTRIVNACLGQARYSSYALDYFKVQIDDTPAVGGTPATTTVVVIATDGYSGSNIYIWRNDGTGAGANIVAALRSLNSDDCVGMNWDGYGQITFVETRKSSESTPKVL